MTLSILTLVWTLDCFNYTICIVSCCVCKFLCILDLDCMLVLFVLHSMFSVVCSLWDGAWPPPHLACGLSVSEHFQWCFQCRFFWLVVLKLRCGFIAFVIECGVGRVLSCGGQTMDYMVFTWYFFVFFSFDQILGNVFYVHVHTHMYSIFFIFCERISILVAFVFSVCGLLVHFHVHNYVFLLILIMIFS